MGTSPKSGLKNSGWVNVTDTLVAAGHAVYQEY